MTHTFCINLTAFDTVVISFLEIRVLLFSEYEKNGLTPNFVDQVFGGEMTSTVMCQQCKTVCFLSQKI